MTALALTYPVQAAAPVLSTVLRSAVFIIRPLFGLGALMTLGLIFKPMLLGVARATKLVLIPRQSLEERTNRSKLEGALMLNRLAKEVEENQPGLAAELRYFASRD